MGATTTSYMVRSLVCQAAATRCVAAGSQAAHRPDADARWYPLSDRRRRVVPFTHIRATKASPATWSFIILLLPEREESAATEEGVQPRGLCHGCDTCHCSKTDSRL